MERRVAIVNHLSTPAASRMIGIGLVRALRGRIYILCFRPPLFSSSSHQITTTLTLHTFLFYDFAFYHRSHLAYSSFLRLCQSALTLLLHLHPHPPPRSTMSELRLETTFHEYGALYFAEAIHILLPDVLYCACCMLPPSGERPTWSNIDPSGAYHTFLRASQDITPGTELRFWRDPNG